MRKKLLKKGKMITLGVVLTFLSMGLAMKASAEDPKPAKKKRPFELSVSASVGESYDDNVFQSRFNAESDLITEGKPGINLAVNAISWLKIGAKYNLKYLYYLNHSELNDLLHQFDFDLGFDFSKSKRFRNFRLGVEANYDPITVSVTNSGDSSINTTQRFTGALAPGYFWKISPRMDLDAEVRIQRTQYFGEGDNNSAADVNLTLRRKISRRFGLRVGGNGTYQVFEVNGTTKIYGASGGLDIEILRRLNGGISGGYQIITLPSGQTADAITAAVNLEYQLSRRTSLSLAVNRSNTVDINNHDFVSSIFTLSARHRLSMRTLLGLDTFYSLTKQESLVAGQVLGDDLTSYGAVLRMQFTDRWTFALRALRDVNGGANVITDYEQNRLLFEVKYLFPFKF